MAFSARSNLTGLPNDAFGRLPVSDPVTLFDSQNQYDMNPLLWENVLTGTGAAAHNADNCSVDISTSADGDKVIRQTRAYHRYQPGKSQYILITGCFKAAGTLSIGKRSTQTGLTVDTIVSQTNWNINTLDTADKDFTLDGSLSQIFSIDMEWLGVGSVRTGFVQYGQFVPAHYFHHANVGSGVYITTANLPLRYEIIRSGSDVTKRMGYYDDENGFFFQWEGTNENFETICGTVISEGGFEEGRGIPFAAGNGTTDIDVTTRRPLCSIRPKATFNSITNRGQIILNDVETHALTNGGYFEIVYDGTLTNASFASVDTNSITEVDTSATAISGGQVITAFYVAAGGQGAQTAPGSGSTGIAGRLPLTLDVAGANPINLSVVCTSMVDTCTAAAAINWKEVR